MNDSQCPYCWAFITVDVDDVDGVMVLCLGTTNQAIHMIQMVREGALEHHWIDA